MDLFELFSFDKLVSSLFVCVILREVMIITLPDSVAGPGGWLIDTGPDEV